MGARTALTVAYVSSPHGQYVDAWPAVNGQHLVNGAARADTFCAACGQPCPQGWQAYVTPWDTGDDITALHPACGGAILRGTP